MAFYAISLVAVKNSNLAPPRSYAEAMESSESVPAEVEGESSRARDARRVASIVAEALIASIVLEAAGYVTMALTTSQQGSIASYHLWDTVTAALFWLGPITPAVLLGSLGLSWWVLLGSSARHESVTRHLLRARRDVRVLRIFFILIVILAVLEAIAGIRIQELTYPQGAPWSSTVQFVMDALATGLLGVVGAWASGVCLARWEPEPHVPEDAGEGASALK